MSPWSPTGIEIEFDFGYDSGPLEGQSDYATADLIARIFENDSVTYNGRTATISTNQPFFIACGIFRPHLPLYMPKAYLDLPELAATNIFATRASLDAMYADSERPGKRRWQPDQRRHA